ncbi:MAG: sensor histidine kinase [Sulfurospirillum sp.]|nr:MAG: sensor histidine kinase [Sulfurospirillum sp.]
MKKSSIFFSITFIFFIAALGVLVAYFNLLKYDKQKYTQELNNRYAIVARSTLISLISPPIDKKFKKILKIYKVKLITDEDYIKKIVQNGEILKKVSLRLGSSSIYYYHKNNYLLVESINGNSILLEDMAYKPYVKQILYIKLIFGGIGIILLLTYIMTIKKLKPIRKIKAEMDKFANGDLDIDCAMENNNEISEVANAFNYAVSQIRQLNNSRRLFLRNIMHELKTPITKGRITAEMLEDGKQKDRLISTFSRLESLLNEFTAIEQISVNGQHLQKRVYRVIDIIDEAIDISMANPEYIEQMIQSDLNIKVDFKLFTVAIKNMIDNGIKYSTDNRVKISANFKSIQFATLGSKLPNELSYYTEPFTQGENTTPGSFGLGLYIVDSILTAHHMKLTYEYSNGYNIFKFINIQPIV